MTAPCCGHCSYGELTPPYLFRLALVVLASCVLFDSVSSFPMNPAKLGRGGPIAFVGGRVAVRVGISELGAVQGASEFQAFEDRVASRIADADETSQCLIDPAGMFNDLMTAPMITFSDVVRLSSAKNNEGIMEDRLKLVSVMKQNGGYVIVKLGEAEAIAMNKMWDCVNDLFRTGDQAKLMATMRHQSLTRDNSLNGGYDYLETTINRSTGNLEPDNLSDFIGREHVQHALNAHRLLENLGEDVAAIAVSATAGVSPQKSRELISRISDDGSDIGYDDETPSSCSVHRLCRYAPAASNNDVEEILRSHTDWTLATITPVADVPGLEVWQPSEESWIRPELTANFHWQTRLHFPRADDMLSWNSRYVVVLAGKWLEILTDGGVESAIHRVVSVQAKPRLSAPFFLRPRQSVPLGLQRQFGEANLDTTTLNDKTSATTMQQFLKDLAP